MIQNIFYYKSKNMFIVEYLESNKQKENTIYTHKILLCFVSQSFSCGKPG